jgi:hypothetical protein
VTTPEPYRFAAGFANAVTLMGIELLGRVYGGGVLKIEPGDSARIPVPPVLPPEGLADQMDGLLREGREREALELSSGWLVRSLGLSSRRLSAVQRGYRLLRDARMGSAACR